ncbi:MAG: hypothetical protein EPN72_00645 [Nevskiaceae bacterium]|nr:MAG: hypothetical protein EPN63_11395 [Nevskiaceae bacterium]TBR74572.1 MAG: hypothetical protein EPN72_00645 [Nevskiaceae bacterium]
MLGFVFVLFLLAACGGVLMLLLIAAGKNYPQWLGTGHGVFALVCLCALFVVNLLGETATPAAAWWALGVFVAGFIGGMLLFRYLYKGRATVPLVLLHGGLNTLGLVLLYNAAF